MGRGLKRSGFFGVLKSAGFFGVVCLISDSIRLQIEFKYVSSLKYLVGPTNRTIIVLNLLGIVQRNLLLVLVLLRGRFRTAECSVHGHSYWQHLPFH
jgi:hypothetical protein